MSFVIFAISVLVLEVLLARFAPVVAKKAPAAKQPTQSKAATSGN